MKTPQSPAVNKAENALLKKKTITKLNTPRIILCSYSALSIVVVLKWMKLEWCSWIERDPGFENEMQKKKKKGGKLTIG